MTCREKLALEHPEYIMPFMHGGCCGCPSDFDYRADPKPQKCSKRLVKDWDKKDKACRECWDRPLDEVRSNAGKENNPE